MLLCGPARKDTRAREIRPPLKELPPPPYRLRTKLLSRLGVALLMIPQNVRLLQLQPSLRRFTRANLSSLLIHGEKAFLPTLPHARTWQKQLTILLQLASILKILTAFDFLSIRFLCLNCANLQIICTFREDL